MKGIDEGYSSEPPVRIFVMGANVWREEAEWPLARTKCTDFFLGANRRLTREPGHTAPQAQFVYDPREPVRLPAEDQPGMRDWRRVSSRSDVLTYTSDPLDRDTEITGHLVARLWVASTAPDTDFTAKVFELDSTGQARPLTAAPGVLRARYRSTEDPQPARPLKPGEPTELTISLGYTSQVLRAGTRLQIIIMGSVFPNLHLNVWEPFRSMDQAVRATQTVFHEAPHASRIILPVIPKSD